MVSNDVCLDANFVDNPIDRYAIGDRTPGLRPDSDGGLTIYVQNTDDEPNQSNWLPSPEEDRFYLVMRLYLPKEAATDGRWSPPAVRRFA